MASEQHNAFSAIEFPLRFFYNKPVVNEAFVFFEDDNETEFDFSGHTNYTFKVWENEEDGKLLLSLSQGSGLSLSGNTITMNASSGQFNFPDKRGKYYFEFSWYTAGGYEIVLMYGELKLV